MHQLPNLSCGAKLISSSQIFSSSDTKCFLGIALRVSILNGFSVLIWVAGIRKWFWAFSSSLLNRVPCVQLANVVYFPTCLRASVVHVSTCQKRANFSFEGANVSINVPTCYPACQCFNSACQRAIWCANFYTLLLYKKSYILLDIKVLNIICICIVNKNCIILYFYTSCHIKEKCGILLFYYFFLFSSLVRSYNIKRPGFYTLQVTRVFSNFPQLKQLSKIKDTCEYWDLHELRSAWIGDPR